MKGHKRVRQRGKPGLSRVFADLKIGDKVALMQNLSHSFAFPKRYYGRTATVAGMQGRSVAVTILDGKMEKKFLVQKIHLKKLIS